MSEREGLVRALLEYVAAPRPELFDTLAARVVAYQVEAVEPYGRLVASLGGLSDGGWRRAALVETELFREVDLTARGLDEPLAVFRTSGTTGQGSRGVRRVPDLRLYEAGMVAPFVEHVLGGATEPRDWISLIPLAPGLPDSSLSHMVTRLACRFALRVIGIPSNHGLEAKAFARTMTELTDRRSAPVILTTSFALVQVLDALGRWSIRAARGTRMMLTGGFKGRTRELREEDLLELVHRRLGIPPEAVVPEYGMTELTSQAYGRPLQAPPWLKLRVVDATTRQDLPAGEEGQVACFDLLNLDNVSAILTSDTGVLDAQGRLTLRGRAAGAPLRGCSLTAEEMDVR